MNTKSFVLAFTLLLGSLSIVAKNTEPTITATGAKSFIIDKAVWKTPEVTVSITDAAGHTIYNATENLSHSKRFNLNALKNGNYTVTVSNAYKNVRNDISITRDGLYIDYDAMTTFKPIFSVKGHNIDINYLVAGQDAKVSIQSDTDVIFTSEYKDVMTINKRFDISELPAGDYMVVVTSEGTSYSKSFSK